ncbi:MAG: MOSC domain-containing protein [Hyphomicrobiaceae bacterium]|nr:MOSC domain-containing protein [Hyphomicrobiaceae bacterium]
MQPHVAQIYRYPVKGLSPEPMAEVSLEPGQTLPHDRVYAIENGPGRFDPLTPRHLPKIAFLMLMRDERLATLKSAFDDATHRLTISRDGKQVAAGDLGTPLGRQMIEQFIAAYMAPSLRGAPRIVSAEGHSFSDVDAKCVHIVNLETVRELGRIMGRDLDPLRFRANVYVTGIQPWSEFEWIGRSVTMGDVELEPFKRTVRCDATNVDPMTGARDTSIPAALQRTQGHSDLGIYAMVRRGGTIKGGDELTVG